MDLEGDEGVVDDAGRVARPARSPATLRAYETDWAGFRAWCRTEGRAPLPAGARAVAAHIEALAPTHGGAALRRRVAAIGFHHRLSGLVWDASHPAIRAALRALGRGDAPHRPRRRVAMPKASDRPACWPLAGPTSPACATAPCWCWPSRAGWTGPNWSSSTASTSVVLRTASC